ncbi:hypothetical protein [Pseudoalteromonas denitrificans]|uniref:Uncharacterized protein n=1 Tax=Pseudoalteromonas denitrificans DSM 6059 TaxID=1123010 RepID=A0A1I1U3G3_9GAMM|nr:hypothetical protein [Pseudoalteromonas denitrificans]SFD63243.1 hypothetical protein SAMN02745724_05032 [Pseudoalteromonas denitrificans DSM 6059]
MKKSKNTWQLATYQTERLSTIPSMASAVSKKISLFVQSHRKMVDEASLFFIHYQTDLKRLQKLKKNLANYSEQIDIINDYKKEHGKLPLIINQSSTDKYLTQLYRLEQQIKKEYATLQSKIIQQKINRFEALDHLTDNMLDLLSNQRIFSQFLGTIALSTPLPDEEVRCIRNEKYKPIYIAGLAVALFEEIRLTHDFKNPYLKDCMQDMFDDNNASFMALEQNELSNEVMAQYREDVLKPIAKAALLQSIGSYSPQAQAIFSGDRYRMLSVKERSQLIEIVRLKSIDYFKFGIGIPQRKVNTLQEKIEYTQFEQKKLSFMLSFFEKETEDNTELLKLLRIPLIYSSFMVSTKPEFNYKKIYTAYDTLKESALKREIDPLYTKLFLSMVGYFPLGSGIYFISQETNAIEKGIVSSLYPANPHEPICKQITRHQIKSQSQKEVIVSPKTNIFFTQARLNSEFEPEFYELKYKSTYTWNANEVWEVQIPALEFWRKDGTRKVNDQIIVKEY